MSKIPVADLYKYLDQMLAGRWGYIWGTSGELWTEDKQRALEARYSEDDPNRGMSVKYGSKWIGRMVTDCSGVMVYIWNKYGLKIPHGSSSMVRQGYIVDCGSEPRPGWAALVDDTPDTPDNNHIGIVGPDGQTVYEAKGTQAGFITSKVSDKKWTKFGRFKDVDYEGGGGKMLTPYYAVVATNSGALNLRSGPGTDYGKIGSVAKGEELIVKIEFDGWAFVEYEGKQGYAARAYLTPIREVSPEPAPEPEPEPGHVCTTLISSDGVKITLLGSWQMFDNGGLNHE